MTKQLDYASFILQEEIQSPTLQFTLPENHAGLTDDCIDTHDHCDAIQ